MRIDLAELLGRVGDRLQAIGEDHARDHRHIGPLAAQRRAAAGSAVDRGLIEDIARIAVQHEERGAVDRGNQVATCAGGRLGWLGCPTIFDQSFWPVSASIASRVARFDWA